MSAFVDTNILVRHLTGDPPELASRATAYLASATELLLSDLIVAETIYVLESFYKVPRGQVADAMRSLVAFRSIAIVQEGFGNLGGARAFYVAEFTLFAAAALLVRRS